MYLGILAMHIDGIVKEKDMVNVYRNEIIWIKTGSIQ